MHPFALAVIAWSGPVVVLLYSTTTHGVPIAPFYPVQDESTRTPLRRRPEPPAHRPVVKHVFWRLEAVIRTCIPAGSLCFQDHSVFRWPKSCDDPETVFLATKKEGTFDLQAPGYGQPGDYGNGSIFIRLTHFGRKQP